MSALVQFTPPAEEPVTLAEAKLHCKGVDGTTDDTLITGLITTARQAAENRTRRALVTQTQDLYLDGFPCWEISLPMPKLQSVTAITYVDNNGVTQTLDAAEYLVDTASEPARLTPAFGKVWPAARWQMNAVKIRYICGYGVAAAVPQCIKTWMLMAISTMYNQREPIITGISVAEVPRDFFAGLLDPEVVRTV